MGNRSRKSEVDGWDVGGTCEFEDAKKFTYSSKRFKKMHPRSEGLVEVREEERRRRSRGQADKSSGSKRRSHEKTVESEPGKITQGCGERGRLKVRSFKIKNTLITVRAYFKRI